MRRIIVIVAALAVAACGEPMGANSPAESPSTSSTVEPDGVISTGNLGVIVPPDKDGEYRQDTMVTCSGNGQFPLSALDAIAPLAEADPGGIAEAIESFLGNEEGQFWPQEGWHILHQTPDAALLVAKGDDGMAFMNVTNDGTGWKWAGSSFGGASCPLEFVYPESVNAVAWVLDPAGPSLTDESVEVAVILNEMPCVDGREIGDRLLPAEIVMTDTHVFMAFAAKRPPGDFFTCPGNPATPYVVELPAPLGDRTLMPGVELGIDLADYVDGAE